MIGCPAFNPVALYLPELTGFVDCHARGLGEEGYRALGNGSSVAFALTGLLTVYVALIGYRMLLGDAPTFRESVISAVKIGFVLALVSDWPAYQVLVYDVVVDAPGEITARIMESGGFGSSTTPGMVQRVQAAYAAIEEAALPRSGALRADADKVAVGMNPPPIQQQPPSALGAPTAAAPLDPTLSAAAKILLIASLAGLLSMRIVAGVVLALGPLFIMCLLFGATRGLFEGWVRALAGSALGTIGVAIVLLAELAVIEPQVSAIMWTLAAGAPMPLLPNELLASTVLFALVMVAVLAAAMRVAAGFRLPDPRHGKALHAIELIGERAAGVVPGSVASAVGANDDRPRARAVADALEAQQRHEQKLREAVPSSTDRRSTTVAAGSSAAGSSASVPLGQSYRRTAVQQRTVSNDRRDATG